MAACMYVACSTHARTPTAVQAGGLIVGEAVLEPLQQILQRRHGFYRRPLRVENSGGRGLGAVLPLEEGDELRAGQRVLVRLCVGSMGVVNGDCYSAVGLLSPTTFTHTQTWTHTLSHTPHTCTHTQTGRHTHSLSSHLAHPVSVRHEKLPERGLVVDHVQGIGVLHQQLPTAPERRKPILCKRVKTVRPARRCTQRGVFATTSTNHQPINPSYTNTHAQ